MEKQPQALLREMCVKNCQGRKARQMMAANGKTHRPLLPFMERTKPQPAQMVANTAEILKDSFASLSQSMSEGFDNLGQIFQSSRSACVSQGNRLLDDLSSADSDTSEVEEPAAKRPKSDEAGQSTENELILGQLEKDFDFAEHKGAEINPNLAAIVSKLLKEKNEEDKLTEIKKRYPAPKNCEISRNTS